MIDFKWIERIKNRFFKGITRKRGNKTVERERKKSESSGIYNRKDVVKYRDNGAVM